MGSTGVLVGGSGSPAHERLYAIALVSAKPFMICTARVGTPCSPVHACVSLSQARKRAEDRKAEELPEGKTPPGCTFKPQVTRKAEELIERERAEKRSIYEGLYDQVCSRRVRVGLAH